MGVSTHIVGFKPMDDKCAKESKVLDDIFGEFGRPDYPDLMEVNLEKHPAVSVHEYADENGFDVDLTKLPKDVTVLRFFNSY